MKKLVVLVCALFLTGTLAFAQSEKTVKQDNKAKTEKTVKKPDTQAVSTDKKDVKSSLQKEAAKAEATEKNKEAVEKKAAMDASKKKITTNSEQSVAVDPAQNESGAEISFKETNHDFGTIPFKGNGSYEFVFVNTGTEPLILTQPKSSCGCTVPEWPRQPILPGESNVIKVTYKNTDRPGNFNKYVTVYSNAAVNKEVKLHIKGTIEPQPTDAAPLKVESFGSPVNKN